MIYYRYPVRAFFSIIRIDEDRAAGDRDSVQFLITIVPRCSRTHTPLRATITMKSEWQILEYSYALSIKNAKAIRSLSRYEIDR